MAVAFAAAASGREKRSEKTSDRRDKMLLWTRKATVFQVAAMTTMFPSDSAESHTSSSRLSLKNWRPVFFVYTRTLARSGAIGSGGLGFAVGWSSVSCRNKRNASSHAVT
ncbi:hypothetical protein GSI_04718 [Ganoderma sinense ZZ0214-1]|uniref:Uncharacterized protein n=1 Tax=Ganoderma sinense ZZ0214-1 TaxID=1077348 RepID=A0A2G8SI76_9APHY|nr:hypothetical protein GSI_04718 [Ganoderma sinense ZZ0214-1]